jgi:phosphatidylinositol alpha-mannosyltransferase
VFEGVVAKDLLPRYFATGHAFCSPATERESFGIVLLEAMASGIPVIGTGIPGYLTILRDRWNSLVVPPRDSDALAGAIITLIENDNLRRQIRKNGLDLALRYRWEHVVDQLVDVYENGHEKRPRDPDADLSIVGQPYGMQKV